MILSKKVSAVLAEMAEFEKQFEAQFSIDEDTGLFLYEFVLNNRPENILELGTWRGASAIYMAAALKSLGRGHIVTVDIGNDRIDIARNNFLKAGVADFIKQEVSDISEFLSFDNNKYDLVFMDATKNQQAEWLKQIATNNLDKKGHVVIDDIICMQEKMTDLQAYVKSNKNLKSEISAVGDGLMIVSFR